MARLDRLVVVVAAVAVVATEGACGEEDTGAPRASAAADARPPIAPTVGGTALHLRGPDFDFRYESLMVALEQTDWVVTANKLDPGTKLELAGQTAVAVERQPTILRIPIWPTLGDLPLAALAARDTDAIAPPLRATIVMKGQPPLDVALPVAQARQQLVRLLVESLQRGQALQVAGTPKPRSALFLEAQVLPIGDATTLGEIAWFAVPAGEAIEPKSCGRYQNLRTGKIVELHAQLVKRTFTLHDRTGATVATQALTAKLRCPDRHTYTDDIFLPRSAALRVPLTVADRTAWLATIDAL